MHFPANFTEPVLNLPWVAFEWSCGNHFDLLVNCIMFRRRWVSPNDFFFWLLEFLNSLFPVYAYDHSPFSRALLVSRKHKLCQNGISIVTSQIGFEWVLNYVPCLINCPLPLSWAFGSFIPLDSWVFLWAFFTLHPLGSQTENDIWQLSDMKCWTFCGKGRKKKSAEYEHTEIWPVSVGKRKVQAISRVFSWVDELWASGKFALLFWVCGCLS